MNFLSIILVLISPIVERIDSVVLEGIEVVAPIKMGDEAKGDFSATTVERVALEHRHIVSLKELSAVAPNFYQPDYGSRMTSSIYVRGFGSRIDQPVVSLSVDEMPVMNKNNYDFDFFDISKVQIIRGAQSTLYGRNTVGGAINVETLSPLTFQGKRLMFEYGNENNIKIKASHYAARSKTFGWSAGLYYSHSDGFFNNVTRGEKCDGGNNIAARMRFSYLPAEGWMLDNTFTLGYVDEGGWGYRAYDAADGSLAPIAYNDVCTYRRFNISDGFVVKRFFDTFTLSSTTGYQFTNDRMRIDNDFLPNDYFTLGQYQKEHSLTQEFVAKSNDKTAVNWLVGAFAFYKHINLDAPVLFKQYGIDNIILNSANENFFHLLGPDYNLQFRDSSFPIEDKFKMPTFGSALFGQFGYKIGDITLLAGLRLDYERSSMRYDSYAQVYYKYRRSEDTYTNLVSRFCGREKLDALELLPRFSVTYTRDWGNVYASASKGYKAGGYNTQLFSDILQKKLTDDILQNKNEIDASSTVYRPEINWTYEVGMHLSSLSDGSLAISGALFFIDCRDQQLTVFPKGLSTGRMMSNAGRSHSYGAELSMRYKLGRLTLDASYGCAYATFRKFISGDEDYSGNYLPLSPRDTYAANLSYNIPVAREYANFLVLNIGWNGVGRIYWNEENTLSQPFYGLWSASLTWEKGHFGASLWGKNLLNERYNTFYFKSIGNNFFAQGKPLQIGASLHINL